MRAACLLPSGRTALSVGPVPVQAASFLPVAPWPAAEEAVTAIAPSLVVAVRCTSAPDPSRAAETVWVEAAVKPRGTACKALRCSCRIVRASVSDRMKDVVEVASGVILVQAVLEWTRARRSPVS